MIKRLFITLIISVGFYSMNYAQQELPEYVPVVKSSWWQIADEDYDAGKFNNKPEPGEPTLRNHQQVSDFTIYKAANGKWQLVSAVRGTNFPGNAHFLFRWEANNIADKNWEEKGVFMTTQDFPKEAKYVEGVFYAPHCVKDAGKYYMFHNSSSTARLMIGDDGIHFKPFKTKDGSYIIFDPGKAGRDLMVLDNRERDGLWYVYYTSIVPGREELKDRQYTDVYVRTSENMEGPWSEETAAGMGTPDRSKSIVHHPANFVNAESPFVIYKDGFYFKFEQTNIVASKDPKNFTDKPVVSTITPHFKYPEQWWPALAPEVIVDGKKMYVAVFMNHNGHPLRTLKQGGIFVAELMWVKRENK